MSKLRVAILDPSATRKVMVELPDDIQVERLIPALVKRMGFPLIGQNGENLRYRLNRIEDNRETQIDENLTLHEADVRNDDTLRLYAEMTAARLRVMQRPPRLTSGSDPIHPDTLGQSKDLTGLEDKLDGRCNA